MNKPEKKETAIEKTDFSGIKLDLFNDGYNESFNDWGPYCDYIANLRFQEGTKKEMKKWIKWIEEAPIEKILVQTDGISYMFPLKIKEVAKAIRSLLKEEK